ncbi:hypothetical protein [Qipengyuania nanhaisediminis]|uniref:hypothetical protein n=1 Tax=Qipengyuania nanhaisediminis TaxID=604088 RepID=UPI0038B2571F
MKKLLITASAIALLPVAANAQLLGGGGGLGGGLGGSLGGSISNTVGSTINTTTRSVRSTVDSTVRGDAATDGDQSVDARNGNVRAERSANGSIAGSTASLADLAVPGLSGTANGNANGQASGQGNASAQLIGTDTVTSAVAPVAGQARSTAASAAAQATATATGTASAAANSAPMPGLPAFGSASASGEGSANGQGSASFIGSPLAVAGSAASAANGVGTVSPGMSVITPEGASLGHVSQIVADGNGHVEQVIVTQGDTSRALPAGMFSAQGDALVAGAANGALDATNANDEAEAGGSEKGSAGTDAPAKPGAGKQSNAAETKPVTASPDAPARGSSNGNSQGNATYAGSGRTDEARRVEN